MAMPQFNLGQRWANISKTVGDIAQMQKSTAERKRAEKMKGEQMLQQTFKDIYGFADDWGKEQTRKRERGEDIEMEQKELERRKFVEDRAFHDLQWQRREDRGERNLDRYIAQRDRAEEIELRTKQFEIKSDQWDEEFSNKVNQQNLEALRLNRQNELNKINRAIDRQDQKVLQAQRDRQWQASQDAINEGNRLEQLSINMELAEQTQELRASVIEDISNMFPASVLTEKNIEDSIASVIGLIRSNTFNEDDENENETITNMLIEAAELMLRGRLEATLNEDAESSAALGDPKFIASATEAYEGIRFMAEGNMNIQTDNQGSVIWGEKEQNELNKRVTDIINTLRESGIYPEITITALEAFHGMSLDRTPKLPPAAAVFPQPPPGWLLFQGITKEGGDNISSKVDQAQTTVENFVGETSPESLDKIYTGLPEREMSEVYQSFLGDLKELEGFPLATKEVFNKARDTVEFLANHPDAEPGDIVPFLTEYLTKADLDLVTDRKQASVLEEVRKIENAINSATKRDEGIIFRWQEASGIKEVDIKFILDKINKNVKKHMPLNLSSSEPSLPMVTY